MSKKTRQHAHGSILVSEPSERHSVLAQVLMIDEDSRRALSQPGCDERAIRWHRNNRIDALSVAWTNRRFAGSLGVTGIPLDESISASGEDPTAFARAVEIIEKVNSVLKARGAVGIFARRPTLANRMQRAELRFDALRTLALDDISAGEAVTAWRAVRDLPGHEGDRVLNAFFAGVHVRSSNAKLAAARTIGRELIAALRGPSVLTRRRRSALFAERRSAGNFLASKARNAVWDHLCRQGVREQDLRSLWPVLAGQAPELPVKFIFASRVGKLSAPRRGPRGTSAAGPFERPAGLVTKAA